MTISALDVLEVHFSLIDYFETTGSILGGVGPRDVGLLESAVARQVTGYGDQSKWDTQYEVISTLFYGLVKNHAFHDANKRIALLCCLVHLSRCGKWLCLDDQQLEDFIVNVADGNLSGYVRRRSQAVGESESDSAVRIIARWIRRNLRNIDNEYREVSYETLKQILSKHDFDLQDPKSNHINVMKKRTKRLLLRPWSIVDDYERIGRIGFHSWKNTVPKTEIKRVRELTGLTQNNGCDTAAFYGWEDPIKYLLGRYETPLRNLADR